MGSGEMDDIMERDVCLCGICPLKDNCPTMGKIKDIFDSQALLSKGDSGEDDEYFRVIQRDEIEEQSRINLHKCKILGTNAVNDSICIKLCKYHLKDCHYVRNKVLKMKDVSGTKICGYSVQGKCNTVNSPIGENEACNGRKPKCPGYWARK